MTEEKDFLMLKWGSIKAWSLGNNPQTLALLQECEKVGMSFSRAVQKNTPKQKKIICDAIDSIDGDIINYRSGEVYETKEAAKQYVMNYGNNK